MIKVHYEATAKLSTKGKLHLIELKDALIELQKQQVPFDAKVYINVGEGKVGASWDIELDTLN